MAMTNCEMASIALMPYAAERLRDTYSQNENQAYFRVTKGIIFSRNLFYLNLVIMLIGMIVFPLMTKPEFYYTFAAVGTLGAIGTICSGFVLYHISNRYQNLFY